jgi:hypothetical protein
MKRQDGNASTAWPRWTVIVIGSISFLVGGWVSALSPVAAQRAAEPGAVLLENDRVVVRQYLLQPGMSTGMHGHGHDYLRVILQGGTVEVTALNGPTRTEKVEVGSVAWRTKTTHSTKNIGGGPIEGLVIEIK